MTLAGARHFFLTKPTHFRIEYAINHWMDKNTQVDSAKADLQWNALLENYRRLGATVEVFEPVNGWPDQVFTGDSIFLYGRHAIAGRFRYPERSGEVHPMIDRFEQRGYTVHQIPKGLFFEGNGEAISWDGHILAGYGARSDREALDFLSKTLDVDVIPFRVLPPHFHLDTIVCPLRKDLLAYVPSGMDEQSRQRIENLGVDLIAVDRDEALQLACNSMALSDDVVVSTHKAPKFHKEMKKAGFKVIQVDLSEFAKSGGGAKCLTLEAYAPNGLSL
ncbi:MAG: arginine deiminase family protein [Anaerolineales bacterium]